MNTIEEKNEVATFIKSYCKSGALHNPTGKRIFAPEESIIGYLNIMSEKQKTKLLQCCMEICI